MRKTITINFCKARFNTKTNKIEFTCDKMKGGKLEPKRFAQWLKDRKKLNKRIIMVWD